MTQKTFELIRDMDVKAVEIQMALHCAPLILCIKPSNLLILPKGQAACVPNLLHNTQIESYLLQAGPRTVLLLYRSHYLYGHLRDKNVQILLRQMGYRDGSLAGLLNRFAARYRAYGHGMAGFPHEMGLFLGYPPEDVKGFIEHKGRNFLYAGYWKVYQDQAQKARLFHYFDQAGELLVWLLAQGVCMKEVLASA